MPGVDPEVYAIRYATRVSTKGENFLNFHVYGEPDTPLVVDYFYWVIRDDAGVTVVDTGFAPDAGSADAVARARPVLEAIGSRVLHVGEGPGAGHALKSLNNLLAATTLLATSEAILAGQRYGLDPRVMLDAINTSSGRNAASQSKLPDYVLPGRDTGFALRLMVKDVAIALGVVRETGAAAPLAEETLALWQRAAAELPPGADQVAIVDWLRDGESEGRPR
jgi:3-hydroxyisobutyrate dehydrogenase